MEITKTALAVVALGMLEKQVSLGRIPEINSDFKEVAWAAATRICQIVTGSPLSVWQGQKSGSFSNQKSLQQSCQSFYGLLQTLSRKSTIISYFRGQILRWRWLRFQNTTNLARLPKVNWTDQRGDLTFSDDRFCQSSSSISTVKGSPDPIRSFNLRFCRMKVHYSRNHHEHDI